MRSGPWLGDPVDGVMGTNFIRFVQPIADDLRQTIAKILEDRLSPATAKPNPTDRVRALMVELMEARASLARVQAVEGQRTEPSAETEAEMGLLREENVALLQEIADLNHRLAMTVPVRSEPSRVAGRLEAEIELLITTLRPDLRFLRDSLTVIAGEFADRRAFYRAVLELGSDILRSSWKRIRGASTSLERHVSTGQDKFSGGSTRGALRSTGIC